MSGAQLLVIIKLNVRGSVSSSSSSRSSRSSSSSSSRPRVPRVVQEHLDPFSLHLLAAARPRVHSVAWRGETHYLCPAPAPAPALPPLRRLNVVINQLIVSAPWCRHPRRSRAGTAVCVWGGAGGASLPGLAPPGPAPALARCWQQSSVECGVSGEQDLTSLTL